MQHFHVYRRLASDRQTVIGYRVMSPSKHGGMRVHFQRFGAERAKAECEAEAARLEAERNANRQRANT